MFGSAEVNGKRVRFGFSGVEDWLDSVILSFAAPWKIGDDTHYGTEIFDATGKHVLSRWLAFGTPSARQKGDMSDEEWGEYCCDSHWESDTQLHLAETIIAMRNYIATSETLYGSDERAMPILRDLVLKYCGWNDATWREISAGGPEKRMLPDNPSLRLSGIHKWNPDR